MVKQKIEGNDNVQVGNVSGNVTIERKRPIFLPNDPNVVMCPHSCGQPTWWNSDKCWNCDRPVQAYFAHQQREVYKKKLLKRVAVLGIFGFIVLQFNHYIPQPLAIPLTIAGVIAIFLSLGVISRAEKL